MKRNLLVAILVVLLSAILVGCNRIDLSEKPSYDWNDIIDGNKLYNVKVVEKIKNKGENKWFEKNVYLMQRDGYVVKSIYKGDEGTERDKYYFVTDGDNQWFYRKDDGAWWWQSVTGYDNGNRLEEVFGIYLDYVSDIKYDPAEKCYIVKNLSKTYYIYTENTWLSKIIVEGPSITTELLFSNYGKVNIKLPSK